MDDLTYMRQALELAREAAAEGEVPVGCVIVCRDQVVGRGRNRRESGKNALCHAEIEAIDQACRTLGGWRLWECTLYVTLEPCAMCAAPSSTPGSPGWSLVPVTASMVRCARYAACFPWILTTIPRWSPAFWRRKRRH